MGIVTRQRLPGFRFCGYSPTLFFNLLLFCVIDRSEWAEGCFFFACLEFVTLFLAVKTGSGTGITNFLFSVCFVFICPINARHFSSRRSCSGTFAPPWRRLKKSKLGSEEREPGPRRSATMPLRWWPSYPPWDPKVGRLTYGWWRGSSPRRDLLDESMYRFPFFFKYIDEQILSLFFVCGRGSECRCG